MEIKTFGVIGAGQMGSGIAQVAAMSGLQVIMNDIKDEFVERGLNNITKILTKNVEKGKMTQEEKEGILGRLKTIDQLEGYGRGRFCCRGRERERVDQVRGVPRTGCRSVDRMSFLRAIPLRFPSGGLQPRPKGRKKSSGCIS